MATRLREELRGMIGRLPEGDREQAREAFGDDAKLGLMEAVFVRLGGAFKGGDALREALDERSERGCANLPEHLTCPRCGARSRFVECRERHLESTAEQLAYRRPVYRCPKCKTFAPLDDELGVSKGEKRSPRLAELLDSYSQDQPYADAAGHLGEILECRPSHSTARHSAMDSGAKAFEAQTERAEESRPGGAGIEPEKRTRPVNKSDTLVICVDGTGVPTREGECREAKVAVLYLLRDRIMKGKREKLLRKREVAYIGNWQAFAQRVYAEALGMGLKQVGRTVVIGDCSEWIDSLTGEFFPGAIRIADFWHVVDYLAKAARESFGEGDPRVKKWLGQRKRQLRGGKVDAVLAALAALPGRRKKKRKDAQRYIGNHREKMKYNEYRAAGLPIGSGAVEGRCKNLVGTRFKRTGALWDVDNAQRLLALRVAYRNGNWNTVYPDSTLRYAPKQIAA